MTRQCVNCPGAEDHSTAQCPLVSEQKNELRQIITDALVSMVSGVTGLVPPAGPGAIPDFIQAPIDRAVERISASLPVGVPDGYAIVPVKPDIEMVEAGYEASLGQPDRSAHARVIEQYDAMLAAAPAPVQHPDDAAVDRFAEAMKAKLAKSRAKGRGGWEDKSLCSAEYLSELLRGHVDKGDPVDVANFCMMLQQRGEGIAAPAQQVECQECERLRAMLDDWESDANLLEKERDEARAELSALKAQQGEGTTSDKYRAELYDEVWQLARDMGYGNVTMALNDLAAFKALKAQQVGQEPAVPECVERIRTLLPRFEAGVNWTGEDAAELAEAAYDAAELLTTKPAPAQDVATPQPDAGGDITLSNEGAQILAECVGAHAYVLGALVNGRPDLAMNEAKKWVDGFMDSGAALAAHDKQSGEVKP